MKTIFWSIALLVITLPSAAQTDSAQLADAVITANRLTHTWINKAQSVGVLTKQNIQQLPGRVAADWLSTVSGVDIKQRGPIGVQADVGIRGGSFDQTLVLLNGMKLSDPQTGHHLLNLPITNEAIAQIDVIKTSASRIYGVNALSGAINFITKVPEKNMLYLGAFGGDFGLFGVHAGAAVHHHKFGQHLSYSRNQSNGYVRNTDFTTQQIFYQADYAHKQWRMNAFGGYTTRAFGAAGFYVINSQEYEKIETGFGGFQSSYKHKSWNLSFQTYYRYNQDEYVFIRSNPSFFRNKHFSHAQGVEFHATHQNKFGKTCFGSEWRNELLSSNNLGKRNRSFSGIYAEHQLVILRKLTITPGIYANLFQQQLSFFPGVDVRYEVKQGLNFFAAIDKGMRLPTYTDLYYNGPSNIGNPNLKAEEAIAAEVGVKWRHPSFAFDAAIFQRNSNNLIDWGRNNTANKWQPLNINEVLLRGLEANIGIPFQSSFLKHIQMGYTYIDAGWSAPENYISRYTLSHLKHQFILNTQWKWYKNVYQSVVCRVVERVSLPGYTLADTKLYYTGKQLTAFVEVANVLDTKYKEGGFATMPGRWFRLGFEWKWIKP